MSSIIRNLIEMQRRRRAINKGLPMNGRTVTNWGISMSLYVCLSNNFIE